MRHSKDLDNLNRLEIVFEEINNCHTCKLCKISERTGFQKPVIDIRNALLSQLDILFISEASSVDDIEYRVPFVGATGLLLRKALHEAGVADCSVALTNAVVCNPYDASFAGRMPTINELENCSNRIKVFIDNLTPKAIVLVGAVARDYYTQKLIHWKYAGDVWLIHHPAYIMRRGGSKSESYPLWVDSIKEILDEYRRKEE